jgi:PKD repeat protein
VNASKVIRVALDDSLDYALAGSESSSTNASVSTITITNTVTPPLITSGLIATAKVGTAFTYTTLTSGSAVSSFTATNLPPGLAIDASTGVISGVPTLANSYLVQLTATNDGGSDTKTLTITVNPTQPIINSPTTAIAIVNTSFTYVTTTDVPATSFSATNLPAGLSINTVSGIISGIPTAVGNSTVVISATNSGGTGTLSLALTVSSGLPSITSATTATATVGTTFTYSIVAPGATSFNATGLPSGLAIDTTTGVISGIPTVAGSSSITLTATNSAGSDTKSLALTVNRVSNSTTAGSNDASGGGMCGSGSGLALLLSSFSLLIVRLNSKRR